MFNYWRTVIAMMAASCSAASGLCGNSSARLKDVDNWYSVMPAFLSAGGNYVMYSIKDLPKGNSTTIIRAIQGDWHIEKVGWNPVGFSADGRRAVLQEGSQSLVILSLGTASVETLAGVSSVSRPKVISGGGWVTYQSDNPNQTLVLRSLTTKEEKRFTRVTRFEEPFPLDQLILLYRSEVQAGITRRSIVQARLDSGELTTLWSRDLVNDGHTPEPQIVFDKEHRAMAWATDEVENSRLNTTIWYFKDGMSGPERITTSVSSGIGDDMTFPKAVDLHLTFAPSGNVICFNLDPKPDLSRPKLKMASVDVWSYKDPQVQSDQRELAKRKPTGMAAVRVSDRRVVRLEKTPFDIPLVDSMSDSAVLLLRGHGGDDDEANWNPAGRYDVVLLSLNDGTERLLEQGMTSWFAQVSSLSPDGKYLVYYNPIERNWFAKDLASEADRNLTERCHAEWTNYYLGGQQLANEALAGKPMWLENGAAFLLCSRNDIWRIDLAGRSASANLTGLHTSRPNVVFRIEKDRLPDNSRKLNSLIIVHAFDRDTKDEGFLRIQPDGKEPDGQVSFQPAHLNLTNLSDVANNASGWLVGKETASSAPNYYHTSDFRTYVAVSAVHPEQVHPGPTAELLTWKSLSGRETQGVLYKPADFDPAHRYPVIFEYYQQMTDELNLFIYPLSGATDSFRLNLRSITEHGYLVFRVDTLPGIAGQSGKTALEAVVSGAQMLATKPWVDARHMGLRGHSFGAYETDYIVAHTGLFAAAVATSGWADFVSAYNGIIFPGYGGTRAPAYERGREWMGGTLWERPLVYIENSPVFQADKVTTPILLMNNTGDTDVNWWEGLEWFNALRRLGKKAWMLQYDNGGHDLRQKEDIADFDRRMMQFFDHYLKDAPPSKWMTDGIPAELKGFEDGFELDTSGREP